MGFGLGTYVAHINGIPYKNFIAPGLIASAAMWSSAFETTYNVYFRMNELRLYDNVLSTPVEVQDLVAGDLLWSASRATVYGIVVLIVVSFFGLIDSMWAIAIPPFVFLGGLCFSVIGYTFTALIPKIDLYSYFFTLGITPMFLFSGIFFPFNQLPGLGERGGLVHAALPPGRDHSRAGDRPGARLDRRQRGLARRRQRAALHGPGPGAAEEAGR